MQPHQDCGQGCMQPCGWMPDAGTGTPEMDSKVTSDCLVTVTGAVTDRESHAGYSPGHAPPAIPDSQPRCLNPLTSPNWQHHSSTPACDLKQIHMKANDTPTNGHYFTLFAISPDLNYSSVTQVALPSFSSRYPLFFVSVIRLNMSLWMIRDMFSCILTGCSELKDVASSTAYLLPQFFLLYLKLSCNSDMEPCCVRHG